MSEKTFNSEINEQVDEKAHLEELAVVLAEDLELLKHSGNSKEVEAKREELRKELRALQERLAK